MQVLKITYSKFDAGTLYTDVMRAYIDIVHTASKRSPSMRFHEGPDKVPE